MTSLTIIKIGGSVATNKEVVTSNLRQELLSEIFIHIKNWCDKNPNSRVVIVHGAGGYIHNLAKQYELTTTCVGNEGKKQNALKVQKECKKQNKEIVSLGNFLGLKLISVPAHEVVTNDNAKIEKISTQQIQKNLSQGEVPVLNGDMVTDRTRVFSICSGDALVTHLSKLFKAERIIYASDIEGLYTNDPHIHPDAKLVENLTGSELNTSNINIGESHNIDVTGGLAGKLADCTKLFTDNAKLLTIEVYNGLEAINTKKILTGEKFPHTTITK